MENFHFYSSTLSTPESHSSAATVQQDTLLKPAIRDTVKKAPVGIDSILLISERKQKEMEAYRKQAAIQKPRVTKPTVEPSDTTCFFCPTAESAPLHTLLSGARQVTDPFVESLLFDKAYFDMNVSPKGRVFIGTAPDIASTTATTFEAKPLAKAHTNDQWMLFPMFGALLTLVFLKIFFHKQLTEVFRGALFFHIASKLARENAILWNRFYRTIDGVIAISIPVTAIIVFKLFNIELGSSYNSLLLSFYILIGIILFRSFRDISITIMGYATQRSAEIAHLHQNQLLYFRIFGIMLVPLNLLLVYSTTYIQFGVIYFLSGFLIVILLLRTFRTLQVFLYNAFSMFYLILYLCALEIIPILIVFKEIFWE